MAIIDNKGKLFGKVSIIDILIVVILLGGIAGIGLRFVKSGSTTTLLKNDKVQVILFCPETPDYTVDPKNAPQGSVVKDATTSNVFGSLKEIKSGPSVFFSPTATGEFVAASKEGFVSAYITAEGYGKYSSSGVVINNVEYSVGQLLEKVKAGKSEFRYNIRVVDIKKID